MICLELKCISVGNSWSELAYENYLFLSLWLSKYAVICEKNLLLNFSHGSVAGSSTAAIMALSVSGAVVTNISPTDK